MNVTRRAAAAALGAFALSGGHALAQTVTTLRLSSSPADDTMPVIYAQQNGTFKRQNIEIELTKAASGSAVAAAVSGGSVDIGKSSVVSVVTARAKGIPFVYIAPGSMYVPAQPDGGLLVTPSSPIKTAKDLEGKIVAVPALGDLNTVATRAWCDQNGGDSKLIQFVEIPVPAQVAALTSGRVAACGIINPFLGDAINAGTARLLAPFYSAISPHFMLSGWFTTQAFADAHRDAIARFQRVIDQTAPYTNAHHAETAPMLAAWSGITLDEAQRAPRMTMGARISAADIQPVIDVLARYGSIPKKFDAREMIVPLA